MTTAPSPAALAMHYLHDLVQRQRPGPDNATPRPAAGSDFAQDSARYPPIRVAGRAAGLLEVAFEHLCLLSESTRLPSGTERPVYPNAAFTLLRGALEQASHAVWLLAPGQSDERVLRMLRLEHQHLRRRQQATDRTADAHEVTEALNALRRDSAGAARWPEVIRRVPLLPTLRAAAVSAAVDPDLIERLWHESGSPHAGSAGRVTQALPDRTEAELLAGRVALLAMEVVHIYLVGKDYLLQRSLPVC